MFMLLLVITGSSCLGWYMADSMIFWKLPYEQRSKPPVRAIIYGLCKILVTGFLSYTILSCIKVFIKPTTKSPFLEIWGPFKVGVLVIRAKPFGSIWGP